jgi:hypothetical protein
MLRMPNGGKPAPPEVHVMHDAVGFPPPRNNGSACLTSVLAYGASQDFWNAVTPCQQAVHQLKL